MVVKPGYKRTDAGIIPEEWDVKPLRAVLDKGRLGGNYPNQDRETEYPLMKMGNIARGSIDISKLEYIIPGVTPEQQHKLTNGDVLFNTRNTLDLVGKVAIWRDELPQAYYNSNLMRLEFDPRQVCSNEYANAALNTSGTITILRGLATGTTSVAAIYTKDLMNMPFVIPPLPEQRAIAAVLSDMNALIRALDQIIAKKRDLKQAAMQQLLTGQTRLPGFQGEWEEKRLDQLGAWKGGMTPSMQNPSYWQGGDVPWISSGDVKSVLLKETGFSVTTSAVRQGTTTLLPANSIVMVTRSGILRKYLPVGMNVIPMAINQDIKALIPAEKFCSAYLLHALIGNGDQILARCLKAGTTVESIEFRWLKAYTIPVPPLAEQIAIAKVLSDMDAELAALEYRREKSWALKQGMTQELLTGRTRLI